MRRVLGGIRFKIWIVTIILIAIHPSAFAAGIRIPENSMAGLGTADALVANPDELGALIYNPAGMSFHQGTNLSLGLIFINPNLSVTPDGGSGEIDSDGNSIITTPNFFLSHRFNPKWSAGIGLHTPFGLETDWPDETFPAFGELIPGDPTTDVDAFEPALTRVEMLNINPNVAYFFDRWKTSVGVGLDIYYVRDAVIDTQLIGIDGDGTGVGWNLGLMHVRGPLSFGVSYRSEVKVDIDGTFDPTALGLPSSSLSTDITFPDMLQFGVRYKVMPVLSIEFDIERTGWSSFDKLTIDHSSPSPPLPNPYTESSNWRDTTTYRLGATYEVIPMLKARLGFAFDLTPQTEGNFSARIPDANRTSIHTGFAYGKERWLVEGGYLYVMLEDRDISNTTPYLGGDPTGTAAYNGKYDSSGHLFGLSFSWRF